MFRTLAAVALALTLSIANIAPSLAIGWAPLSVRPRIDMTSAAFVSVKRPAMAPLGYVVFCSKYPTACRKPSDEADYVDLDVGLQKVLFSVNRRVNRAIAPVNDPQGGATDVWTIGRNAGDCEDTALAKRVELLRRGLPAAALRIGIAVTPSGIGHAVLIVRTNKGDMVLDNRHDVILNWRATDLAWVKVQSGEDPRKWFSV